MDERDVSSIYESICTVLAIFEGDVTFYPRSFDLTIEFNPSRDKHKVPTLRIESCWEWRSRVLSCFRTSSELYEWEQKQRNQYVTLSELLAFKDYYTKKVWNKQAGWAVIKIHRQMERRGVFWY